MNDRILMFVDALPYCERERLLEAVPGLGWTRPIQPGFGYSINVKSELFAGLVPDDAGFLNEWTHAPGAGVSPVRIPRWVERAVSSRRVVSRVVRRVLGKLLGVNAYERAFPRPSVFTERAVERFLYSEHGGDAGAFDALMAHLDAARAPVRAFLATAHLDHVLHCNAIGSAPYEAEVRVTIGRLNALWEALERRGFDGELCLVSDHGMAAVHTEVSFPVDECVAGAGTLYGWFVDATMARIWSDDADLLDQVAAFARERALPGHFLDAAERERWGVRSPAFGDLLFLLDEGYLFVPSFMGDRGVAGMHGYCPSLASQRGLLAASSAFLDGEGIVPATEAYRGFERFFA